MTDDPIAIMSKLRVLDLFSGIGGMSLGLERTGKFETVAFSEIDPYASKVLAKWWPDVPNFKHGIVGLNALLKRVRTASRPAFLARISHSLVQAPDLPEPARDSFGHLCEPFAWFDPGSRSWRTWQRCLIEGWETYSATWPRSGMTRNGIAYRRQPLVPLTDETASGSLLPTPEASNTKARAMRSGGRPPRDFLAKLPTPTATANMLAPSMQKWPAHRNMMPPPRACPTARDWRSGKASAETHDKNSRPLSEQVGGSLNPTWVEWLMAYPLGWTDLDASETASSRSSRSSSPKRSSKRKG